MIPPGMEFRNVSVQDIDGEIDGNESSGGADPPIWSEV